MPFRSVYQRLGFPDAPSLPQALNESEERFQGAFDHAAIGMALVAPDGRFLHVNRSLCRLTGYDEDEFWFQFAGNLRQETEHGVYTVSTGEVSMAEAGISHTSTSHPGALRVTTYTDRPIRMVVDPSEHLRESKWEVREDRIRGWSTNGR